ncbi:hypothetical protein CRUP_015201 [Coryphaenoides rupestris]|nr:hypothetical protein CRUP_015201 [Coryphaenoides rupestris]
MSTLRWTDSGGEPLCLISSSVESGAELLKVQYFKADRNSPNFKTVTFTSLDLLLHTEALLSTINFLSATLSSGSLPSPERDPRPRTDDPSKDVSAKPTLLCEDADTDVIDLKVMMQLGAFNVLVCDQSCNMADIKIQDFIVINIDPKSIHKKVVYLHKFLMSLLNFTNHFQAGKEALSAATAQAAEKAASSMRDFTQKSFRLSIDVKLKAPLIIIPQSSISHNALEVDLGLITVENSFSVLPVKGCPLPAIIDNMDVQLTELKLSRICMDPASDVLGTMLLEPVNLVLSIKRNLASSWYKNMAAVEIDGDLKPMKVSLSQEDLTVLLKILTENLGEASVLQSVAQRPEPDSAVQAREDSQEEEEPGETVKFNFNIESLGLVLYSNDPKQVSAPAQRQENLQLGQFALLQLRTSGKLLTNGSMEESSEPMIDVTYRQSATQREVVAVLQKLYLCASMDFLMAVSDFFVQAMPQSAIQLPVTSHADKLPLKHMPEHRITAQTAVVPRTRLRAVVVDPEVVFVANLMKADAPALVASFQCDFSLSMELDGAQSMKVNLRELKVLACPFIHSKEDKTVTTISPVILNTVMTITAVMTAKPQDQQDQEAKLDIGGLWSIMNIYECNFWFLGVDQATEITESFREKDESSFKGLAKNWSSLLNLTADMTLEMKNNPVQDKSPAFSEGTASTFGQSLLKEKAPYTICNSLGIPLMVQPSASLRVVGSPRQGQLQDVAVGQRVDLDHSVFLQSSSRGQLSALQRQESCVFNLSIVPSGYSEISNIAVDKLGRRLYNVRGPMLNEAVSVLLQIDASEGNKVITVRSPLQIKNHFSLPFAILKYCNSARRMVEIGVAEPEKEFHVALESYRSQLFLQPEGPLQGHYGPSATCISWKEQVHRSAEVLAQLQCPASDTSFLPLMVSTLAVPDHLRHISNHGDGDWDPAYIIHLNPVVTLRNLLPYTIHYLLEGSAEFHKLMEGSTSDVLNARVSGEIMELVLIKYQGRDWHGHLRIDQGMPEFLSLCFTCDTDPKLTVDVTLHVAQLQGPLLLTIFSPYWIINKTSRVLQYRAEEECVKHPADYRDVILFSFRKKNLFSKNKIQLSVSTSSLSEGFSLDTVGSYGCVRCPANTLDYLVGVSIQMSSFNLTRIVTMSPFYTLINKSSYELEVGEVSAIQRSADQKWHYISASECLPLWPDRGTVKLCVRAVGSESNSKSFYFNKQDNGTLLSMDELKPGEAQHFAWDDPAGMRKLSWNCLDHSGELDLVKDECGQFAYDGLSQVHWVSFLDGRQRVLLFTEDVAVVTKARQAEELEQFEQEVNVSLQNLGLSLVNNTSRQEIAYVGITSSGVVWEMKPKNRWKSFNQKNINLLEKAYQSHLAGKREAHWVKLVTNIEVNFGKVPMLMRQPFSCAVRRNFLSGIQVEFKQSPHQRSLRAQLHWLQEMAVKLDQGFLSAIVALFTPAMDGRADGQKTKLIQRDLETLQAELMEASLTDTSGLSFFEHFHISPIKLHLSLSLGSSGEESGQQDMVAIQSLNLLLKSIGATLTDVDDLIFKLAFFEVRYQFYRREKLMWAVIRHYSEQFLKQMYVLVLGGAAGMVSRITGSVGKGLAAITMDKEYQQKRREEMNRPPKDFGESLAKGGKGFLKKSEIQQLEGEVFRDHCLYPGHRKTNIIVTNRRVMCVKEIDFVGHFNTEWEYLFENFNRPPVVAGTELQIYCKEPNKLNLPRKDGQDPVRVLQLRDQTTAQKLQVSIEQAQVACQQYKMMRQKSQRFLKQSNKP